MPVHHAWVVAAPQFTVPLSPEEQHEELERQKRKVMEAAEQHVRDHDGEVDT